MKSISGMIVGGLLFASSCVGGQQTVRPAQMTVQANRAEAAKDSAAAQEERAQFDSPAAQPNQGSNPNGNPVGYYYPTSLYSPRNVHLIRSQQLDAHAKEHVTAAAKLETFEQGECRQFPAPTRAACPLLGPVTEIAKIAHGVRIRFAPSANVDAVFAHMRCHLAYSLARGGDSAPDCALYVPGVEVRRGTNPRDVEIISHRADVARKVQDLTREESFLVSHLPH